MTDYILPSPRKVSALYDYPGENPHELNFHEGDTIEVVNTFNGAGWWYGSRDGKFGIFPSNYCAPTTEQRKLKKRETTSMFIKKMHLELGFVRDNAKSDSIGEETHADGAEEYVAYQKMIMEMKDYILELEKTISGLKADNNQKTTTIEELTGKLESALKKEIEAYTEMAMQNKLISELGQKSSPSDDALAVISDLRSQIRDLEEGRQILQDEVGALTSKLTEALQREEEAVLIMEDQHRQLSEHEERKQQQVVLEEKLAAQLDETLKKEEEAYSALVDLQKQVADQEEHSRRQSELLEKMTAELDDALKKEEEADNFITAQQKRLVESEEAKEQYADNIEKITTQLNEAQAKERDNNKLIADLQEKIAASDRLDRQQLNELEKLKVNKDKQHASRKEENTFIATAELQKRHTLYEKGTAAEGQIESQNKTSKPYVSRSRRYASPFLYLMIGLSIGIFAAYSYHC